MPKKYTSEEYKTLFANLYPDYELLSEYLGDKKYITVKCKFDGNIWQTKPNWLKNGSGCQECYNRRRGDTTRKSKEQFISESKKIHGDKYDYSEVEYKNNKIKVCIVCSEHGKFWMTPNKHLSGQGCDCCADERNGFNKRLTTEEFIKKAREKHGDKYDYSKVNYITTDDEVEIICPIHGPFTQKASIHISGSGCKECNESHLEREIVLFLEKNNILYEPQKRFPDWLGRQSLDFYLPDYNIGIECQGTQHYENRLYNGWNIDESSEIIERDVRKYNLCKEFNIKLLYYAKSKKILDVPNIYDKTNTFLSKKDLLKAIKNLND